MESKNLDVYGSGLSFFAASGTEAAKTVLKGLPMHAVKEGHKVEAVELHLIGDKSSGGHRVAALGPGRINLYDKTKDRYALHATWKKRLTSSKEREGDKVL